MQVGRHLFTLVCVHVCAKGFPFVFMSGLGFRTVVRDQFWFTRLTIKFGQARPSAKSAGTVLHVTGARFQIISKTGLMWSPRHVCGAVFSVYLCSGWSVYRWGWCSLPVFWVICLFVIICLHLGSISSLFLFCFRHCRTFLASASVQNLCTETERHGGADIETVVFLLECSSFA